MTELTKDKKVNPDTFARMAGHYCERAICEIVWLVASEHFYNMTNIALNITAIDGGRVRVRNLEVLDGTPIIDVKPIRSGNISQR